MVREQRSPKRLAAIFAALLAVPAALFVLGWTFTLGDYPVAPTAADDPSLPVIEANGYRFHGEVFGDSNSRVVIVVHGGPGWDYRSLLPLRALADDYRVVFYDQRGSGLSPRVPAETLGLEPSLADLDAIVETFRGDGPVVLIGHSWGAMLASAYLARAPHKVSHAVLIEPGFLNAELLEQSGLRMGPRWEAGYLFYAARRWFESLHVEGPDSEAGGDYFLGDVAARANPEYYCNDVIPEAGTLHWRAGATAMRAVLGSAVDADGRLQFDITDGLQEYRQPVLLLASSCNRLIGVEQQRRHLKHYAAAELVVIPDSGHMVVAEEPEATLAAIRRYLAKEP